jgi:hypothetical protein
MHERALIRAAIVAALKGNTPAGDRVFKRRSKPFRQSELPVVNVYFTDEPIAEGSNRSAPRRLERDAVFNIDFFTGQPDEELLDDELDAADLAIEQVLDNPATLGSLENVLIRDCILQSTEAGIVISGNMPMGCIHIEYLITYRTAVRAPAPVHKFDELELKVKTGTQEHTNVQTGINQEGP